MGEPSRETIGGAADFEARPAERLEGGSLAAAHKSCDDVISLLAHELRGPLATLNGYAQLLVKKGLSPQLQEKAVQSVLEQTKRMNSMVDNLLQASRLAAGRLRVSLEAVEFVSLVRQMVEQQQALAPHHRLNLDVPDQFMPARLDAALAGLALANVVQNAIKFSPRESEILIFLRRTDHRAVVSVVDAGPGISSEDLRHVFEPYRTERGGMGVGLFVAKGIVEAQNGEIGINSQLGTGTTVWLSVPLANSG